MWQKQTRDNLQIKYILWLIESTVMAKFFYILIKKTYNFCYDKSLNWSFKWRYFLNLIVRLVFHLYLIWINFTNPNDNYVADLELELKSVPFYWALDLLLTF